ncbi:MAG: hypothetical protein V4555_05430 [Acidobacteriota bacterium]
MQLLPSVLTVWFVLVAALMAVGIYRAHLTRQETEQLFLWEDDGKESSAHEEQEIIQKRVHIVEPVWTWLTVAAIVDSVLVVGLFVWQELPMVRF